MNGVHRHSLEIIVHCSILKHPDRQSYQIHTQNLISAVASRISTNSLIQHVLIKTILIHTHFPVEITSGSPKPTFPEFQLAHIYNDSYLSGLKQKQYL